MVSGQSYVALLIAFVCGAVALETGAPAGASQSLGKDRPSLRGQTAEVTVADVETSLVAELAGNVSVERLRELEAALKPMYDALPKEESGYLGHQSVRYALHRLLLQRHGWFIVGLEPTDEALPPYLHTEWVPQYLQGLLEQRLGNRGIDLGETAALAASLEDLVHTEASRRVNLVFELLGMPMDARLTGSEADRALETYMMMYLDGGNFTMSDKDMDEEVAIFKQQYSDWESAASWMQQIKGQHVSSTSDSRLGRAELVSIANQLGDRFGAFNDGECRSLKSELMGLEGPKPGRVPLVDFYSKGLYSHWEFNERVEYLRVLGALDESDELHPSVIVANYIGSRPNCLAASNLYAVCCRNECEDLMGHLERKIAAPDASPEEILAWRPDLPRSETVSTSSKLSKGLVQRLQGIAEKHGGRVPLHGRLFAQWMHHVYPHECPYPHEGGVNPQTPDAWMQEVGAEHSEDEVRKIVDQARPSTATSTEASAELPWTDAEVLLAKAPSQTASPLPYATIAKAALLIVLVMFLSLHKSDRLGGGSRSSKTRFAPNLDFAHFDGSEDDPKKPSKNAPRWQQWVIVLALLAVCIALEAMGLLDRFSFGCMLLGGLVLNVGLPLLAHHTSSRSLKQCK